MEIGKAPYAYEAHHNGLTGAMPPPADFKNEPAGYDRAHKPL